MQEKYDGGTAFPASALGGLSYTEGMTLRDYFAAKAMQAMLSSPHCPMHVKESQLATQAYSAADAMLEAREQQ
jgi:hypothetical protein